MKKIEWIAIFVPLFFTNILIYSIEIISIEWALTLSISIIIIFLTLCIIFGSEVEPLIFKTIVKFDKSTKKIRFSYYFTNKSNKDIMIREYLFNIYHGGRRPYITKKPHGFGLIVKKGDKDFRYLFPWRDPIKFYGMDKNGKWTIETTIDYIYEGKVYAITSFCEVFLENLS